jgi:predicted alpha/beta-hydrolase family hydrolase
MADDSESVTTIDVDTPHGPARVHLHEAGSQPVAALVLGHGAGGGVAALDLLRATEVANEQGVSVALVEQPYRVAGRRAPAPPAQLDAAWLAVIEHLTEGELAGLPLIAGGRSLGARVACRTAADVGAVAVLCLAFPVHPPGRPEKSRLEELDAVEVPTLVVQGKSDPFGMPPPAPNREVVEVQGDHGLKKDLDALGVAVGDWLRRVTRLPGAPAGT